MDDITRAAVQSIVGRCPSFDGKAGKELMAFIYNTDLSFADYEEIAGMITMRMFQYADQEVAQAEQIRKKNYERIAALVILVGLTALVAAVTAGIVAICLQ